MITDHVWRKVPKTAGRPNRLAIAERACGYLNCRRPPAEHARATGRARSL